MKTFSHRFILLLTVFTLTLMPLKARAELPPRAKAFLMVSGYGAASGALLGLASMAFGTSSRAIAQGASLGLYAGILFGTYVIVSHHQRSQRGSYDNSTPYNEGADDYGDYGEEKSEESSQGGFFDSSYRVEQMGEVLAVATDYRSMETKKGSPLPPLQLNFFSYQF